MASQRRFSRASVLALVTLATLAIGATAFPACSNQGEGERCNRLGDNNGNDECVTDELVCTPAGELNGSPNDNRCCPPDRTTATTVVCSVSPSANGADAAPPPESGTAADVSVDAPHADTGTDSGTDTGTDSGPGDAAGG